MEPEGAARSTRQIKSTRSFASTATSVHVSDSTINHAVCSTPGPASPGMVAKTAKPSIMLPGKTRNPRRRKPPVTPSADRSRPGTPPVRRRPRRQHVPRYRRWHNSAGFPRRRSVPLPACSRGGCRMNDARLHPSPINSAAVADSGAVCSVLVHSVGQTRARTSASPRC